MVDLVTLPIEVGKMKYLIFAWEDLTNKVEGKAPRRFDANVTPRRLMLQIIGHGPSYIYIHVCFCMHPLLED